MPKYYNLRSKTLEDVEDGLTGDQEIRNLYFRIGKKPK